jgi:magnesium transporter
MRSVTPTLESKHPFLAQRPGIRAKCLDSCTLVPLERSKRLWVDVETPSEADLAELHRWFKLNPLALEDARERGQWSRFEVYAEHLFLVFRTLAEPEDLTDRTERISVFWFPELETVLTFRNEPVTYLENVWNEVNTRAGLSAAQVLYALLDRGSDTFFTFLDELEERTDSLEEEAFTAQAVNSKSFLSEVFALKHVMIHARRLASGAREAVAQSSRHTASFSPDGAMYLRDVNDHLTRIYDGLDSAREVIGSLLDVHLRVQSNRMNEVMKTLTTVSTIFLPLTFLAGVWGMNFKFMPELEQPWGYALAWGMFVLAALAFAAYFKWRKWW